MNWDMILDYLLKGLGSALATLLITFASILFAKLSGKIKDTKITNYIKEVVKAAEQIYPNQGKKMGKEKYAYVVKQVIAKFPSLEDNDYLKSLIEGAVFALTKELEKASAKSKLTTVEQVSTPKEVKNKLSSF